MEECFSSRLVLWDPDGNSWQFFPTNFPKSGTWQLQPLWGLSRGDIRDDSKELQNTDGHGRHLTSTRNLASCGHHGHHESWFILRQFVRVTINADSPNIKVFWVILESRQLWEENHFVTTDTGGNWASAFRKSMKMVRVTMRLLSKIRICWPKFEGPKGPNKNSIMEEKTPWDWEKVDELMVNAGWESPAIYGRCGWWWRRAYASWNQSQGAPSLQFGEHQGTPKWIVLVSIHHKKSILKWDQGLFWMASKLRPCRDFWGQTRVAFSLCCAYGWSIGGEGAKHWESTGYLHNQTIQVKVSIQKKPEFQ